MKTVKRQQRAAQGLRQTGCNWKHHLAAQKLAGIWVMSTDVMTLILKLWFTLHLLSSINRQWCFPQDVWSNYALIQTWTKAQPHFRLSQDRCRIDTCEEKHYLQWWETRSSEIINKGTSVSLWTSTFIIIISEISHFSHMDIQECIFQ